MKFIFLWVSILITLTISGQSNQTSGSTYNEESGLIEETNIKAVIESFLSAIGNYETDSLTAMFTAKANISGSYFRNGMWNNYSMTIDEFLRTIRESPNPRKYKEPVNHWTIHIEAGRLAFVRADAVVFRDGKAQSHNIDYFTLIKENDSWKILNGSYVSQQIDAENK